jgi:hypothetical protein
VRREPLLSLAVRCHAWQTIHMPGGRHTFYIEGKQPLMLWIVASLLFGNTLLMFLLDYGRKHAGSGRLPAIAY